MHDEALITLPQVLKATGVRETILVGHSDGGSIALIHAGSKDARDGVSIRGLILEAPHVFVEEGGLDSIRAIAEKYRNGQLRDRLQRYHRKNVDETFWRWNQVWLDPAFRPYVHLPRYAGTALWKLVGIVVAHYRTASGSDRILHSTRLSGFTGR